jgi:hypothetical protein
MLVIKANGGATVPVRPVSPRCLNSYIDESPPPTTSAVQQLVTTPTRVGNNSSALTTLSSIPLSFFASKDCTYTDSSGRPVPAPKGSDPLHNRFRDDIRVVGQPQESEVYDPPRPTATYTLTISSSSTAVTLPPTSRKRRRSGSDPSSSDSQWTSDALMRPVGLEANIVRDLVNCARFSSIHFPFRSFISR